MLLKYDQTADALHIRFSVAPVDRSEQLEPGTLVDIDWIGRLVGIELIRPARAWPLEDVVERFALADEDVVMLRSLWPSNGVYPFVVR